MAPRSKIGGSTSSSPVSPVVVALLGTSVSMPVVFADAVSEEPLRLSMPLSPASPPPQEISRPDRETTMSEVQVRMA